MLRQIALERPVRISTPRMMIIELLSQKYSKSFFTFLFSFLLFFSKLFLAEVKTKMYRLDETSVKVEPDVDLDLDIEILKWQESSLVQPINNNDSYKDSDPETGI
jgi:hypothetical protein